jgi:hypothetical protein
MYVVYGKHKEDKRFKPFDMRNNKFVINLINASMFDPTQLEELKKEVNYMNELNKDYVFEIRNKG